MGVPISKEQAEKDRKRIHDLVHQLPFTIQRAGSYPPDGMYAAYVFSVGHRYGVMWNAETVFNMIEKTQECPDPRTRVRIHHGTEDLQVPHQSSEELSALFEKKGWPKIDLILHEGKPHAWDYEDALTESSLNFLIDCSKL
jgi:hypothetical protein